MRRLRQSQENFHLDEYAPNRMTHRQHIEPHVEESSLGNLKTNLSPIPVYYSNCRASIVAQLRDRRQKTQCLLLTEADMDLNRSHSI